VNTNFFTFLNPFALELIETARVEFYKHDFRIFLVISTARIVDSVLIELLKVHCHCIVTIAKCLYLLAI